MPLEEEGDLGLEGGDVDHARMVVGHHPQERPVHLGVGGEGALDERQVVLGREGLGGGGGGGDGRQLLHQGAVSRGEEGGEADEEVGVVLEEGADAPVSYTHLTLPTICSG